MGTFSIGRKIASFGSLVLGLVLMIAGLAAQGVTTIEDIFHIERGYADMEGKLRALGAEIEKRAITQSENIPQPDQEAG